MTRRRGATWQLVVTAVVYFLIPVAVVLFSPWWLLLALLLIVVALLALSRGGRQMLSVTRIGIATIPQRLGASSVVVVGIAGVVAVLVALLAMAQGFQQTLKETGNDETAIVMRAGSQTELNSVLDHDTAVLVSQAPQVMRGASGEPIASPELVVVASLPKKGTGLDPLLAFTSPVDPLRKPPTSRFEGSASAPGRFDRTCRSPLAGSSGRDCAS